MIVSEMIGNVDSQHKCRRVKIQRSLKDDGSVANGEFGGVAYINVCDKDFNLPGRHVSSHFKLRQGKKKEN